MPIEVPGRNWGHYISLSWLSGLMVKAYKQGLSKTDLYDLQARDQAITNAHRLQRLWERETEVSKAAGRSPSFAKTVWIFCRVSENHEKERKKTTKYLKLFTSHFHFDYRQG